MNVNVATALFALVASGLIRDSNGNSPDRTDQTLLRRLQGNSIGFCGLPDVDNPWVDPVPLCSFSPTRERCLRDDFFGAFLCVWLNDRCSEDSDQDVGVYPVAEWVSCSEIVDKETCQLSSYFGFRSCVWYERPTTPTLLPSSLPTSFPTSLSTTRPSVLPTSHPSVIPSGVPSLSRSSSPSIVATTTAPSSNPSTTPTEIDTTSWYCGPPQFVTNPVDVTRTCGRHRTQSRCARAGFFAPRTCQWYNGTCSASVDSDPDLCSILTNEAPCAITSFIVWEECVWQQYGIPSIVPTSTPSLSAIPTDIPTLLPSLWPSLQPTAETPSTLPSSVPSFQPTIDPSTKPTTGPSNLPSSLPSTHPSGQPSSLPSTPPSGQPSSLPSTHPSNLPSLFPSTVPSTDEPTWLPSREPSSGPITNPTGIPSAELTEEESGAPSTFDSAVPSVYPSSEPPVQPYSIRLGGRYFEPDEKAGNVPVAEKIFYAVFAGALALIFFLLSYRFTVRDHWVEGEVLEPENDLIRRFDYYENEALRPEPTDSEVP